MIEVEGKRQTVCQVLPTFKEHRGKEHLQIDGIIRENARVGLNEPAAVRRGVGQAGRGAGARRPGRRPFEPRPEIHRQPAGRPAGRSPATACASTLFGNRRADFLVKSTRPAGRGASSAPTRC